MAAWSKEEGEKLVAMVARGAGADEIADVMGRTLDSVHGKMTRLKRFQAAPSGQAFEVEDVNDVEELAAMARSANITHQPQVPAVTSSAFEEDDVADMWKRAEDRNAKHIEGHKAREKFSVDFPQNQPIGISFISDQHIAPGESVDMARMRADAEYVRDTPNLYAILMGDGVNNHIKHRGAMMAARSTPGDQWKLFDYYLAIFAPKILAMCSGNHDGFTDMMAGIDMVQWIAQRQKICYSPAAFRMEVKVGGYHYKVAARHQYRMNSSFNQTHAVKQWQRLGDEEFDIGAVGHHHEPAMESSSYRGQETWVCRPGSYQISSGFSRQYGYNSAYPTCPTVILWPGKRDMAGFSDMRKAGGFLKSLIG